MTDSGDVVRSAFAEARARLSAWRSDHPERPLAVRAHVNTRRRTVPIRPAELPHAEGPLGQAVRELAGGQTTALVLVEAALRAAEEHSGLNPMALLDADTALSEAATMDREARAGHLRGVLHGVPMTVKDVIHVQGLPTRAGSGAYEVSPSQDATSVARRPSGRASASSTCQPRSMSRSRRR